jgi:cytochrome c2
VTLQPRCGTIGLEWQRRPRNLTAAETREIASYLWATGFFKDSGDAAAGRRVFAAKQCGACHNDHSNVTPKLVGKAFSGITMVSALWHCGPQMLEQTKARGIAWPRFEGAQMSDLIAFLNSDRQ